MKNNYSGPERRRYPRPPLNVEIYCEGEINPDKKDVKRGTGVICLYCTNISVGGIFLESTVPFSIGTVIHLRFQLPNTNKPIYVVGKVIRHQTDNDNFLEGIAIEFVRIGYQEKAFIEEYIKSVT